jgi:carbon-monoxide dehydrogenase medium subunit
VTLSRLVAASEMPGMPGALLRRGARAVASHQLRNVITVGGNIAHLAYWADLPVVLLALDAELEVRRQGEAPARVPLADALAPGRHAWQGGLITRVLVPLRPGVFSFGHERFARTAADYSLATVCVTFRLEGGSATEVRLVAGAVQNRPLRVAAAEAALEGARLASDRIEQAASALATSVPIAPNFRASPEYRRKLLAALARRAIGTAAHWSARES